MQRINNSLMSRFNTRAPRDKSEISRPSFDSSNVVIPNERTIAANGRTIALESDLPKSYALRPQTSGSALASRRLEKKASKPQLSHANIVSAQNARDATSSITSQSSPTTSYSSHGRQQSDHPSTDNGLSASRPEYMQRKDTVSTLRNGRDPSNRPSYTLDRDSDADFDLAPPPPNADPRTVEGLALRLFSAGHLHSILRDPAHNQRFVSFLMKYKPTTAPLLSRYLEMQNAMKAIQYANALADNLTPMPGLGEASKIPCEAAMLDSRFETRAKRALKSVVEEGLTAYVTRALVEVVTDSMIRAIMGKTLPVMEGLVHGLSEVFVLSDPRAKDNPIVYASEDFYRLTQYSRDFVIGRNCRFLQGPKTDRAVVARIGQACREGKECCETLLNYKKDGTCFLNLLMSAPLFDNRGQVRYFIGAQVDVSELIEEGRGIDSFARYLKEEEEKGDHECERRGGDASLLNALEDAPRDLLPTEVLGELAELFDVEDTQTIHQRSRVVALWNRKKLMQTGDAENGTEDGAKTRLVLGSEVEEKPKRGFTESLLSGRLPGVYQNYMLVRPGSSLPILFVSPSLRIPGLLQSSFLSRIAGPPHVKAGVAEAFSSGVPVTAKVRWLSQIPGGHPVRTSRDDWDNTSLGYRSSNNSEHEYGTGDERSWVDSENGDDRSTRGENPGKTRWLSCTPLLGSDDRVGVWMVVMVEEYGNYEGASLQPHLSMNTMARGGSIAGSVGTAILDTNDNSSLQRSADPRSVRSSSAVDSIRQLRTQHANSPIVEAPEESISEGSEPDSDDDEHRKRVERQNLRLGSASTTSTRDGHGPERNTSLFSALEPAHEIETTKHKRIAPSPPPRLGNARVASPSNRGPAGRFASPHSLRPSWDDNRNDDHRNASEGDRRPITPSKDSIHTLDTLDLDRSPHASEKSPQNHSSRTTPTNHHSSTAQTLSVQPVRSRAGTGDRSTGPRMITVSGGGSHSGGGSNLFKKVSQAAAGAGEGPLRKLDGEGARSGAASGGVNATLSVVRNGSSQKAAVPSMVRAGGGRGEGGGNKMTSGGLDIKEMVSSRIIAPGKEDGGFSL